MSDSNLQSQTQFGKLRTSYHTKWRANSVEVLLSGSRVEKESIITTTTTTISQDWTRDHRLPKQARNHVTKEWLRTVATGTTTISNIHYWPKKNLSQWLKEKPPEVDHRKSETSLHFSRFVFDFSKRRDSEKCLNNLYVNETRCFLRTARALRADTNTNNEI